MLMKTYSTIWLKFILMLLNEKMVQKGVIVVMCKYLMAKNTSN
jgi:hypothetical protein